MLKKIFSQPLNDRNVLLILVGYIFFLLLTCSNMSPFYYTNEWADVNIYHNIGKAIFNGRTLYTEIFDHKGPFIFFIYGLGYLISGDSFFGMFLIEFIAWLIMTYVVYKTARLFLSATYSSIVALIFPVFLIQLMKSGGSAEEFILVFQSVSFYLFIKYFKDKDASIHKPVYMFVHGITCAAVIFIKINLVIFWFFPLLGIFVNILLHKEYKNFLLNVIAYIGGFLVIALPICIYLYVNGALQEAYNIYIDLNRRYAEIQTLGETCILLIRRISYLFIKPVSLFLFCLLGIFYFPLKYIENPIGRWAIVLSGISLYIIIFMSKVFQYYYPIPFLIFSVLGLIAFVKIFSKLIRAFTFTVKYLFLFAFTMYYVGFSQGSIDETKLCLDIMNRPDLLTQDLHDEIMKEPDPTLLNLGFGLGNSLFTTCHIVPNIRYFISPNLTYDAYPDLRSQQEEYIKNKATKFVLIQFEDTPMVYKEKVKKERRKINNQKYFENLPAFQENYYLVMMDTIVNTIDEKNLDIYALYKRKDK